MSHRDNRACFITRSFAHREVSALTLLRAACAQGLSDEQAIAWAVAVLGKEEASIVARVWARKFAVTRPV